MPAPIPVQLPSPSAGPVAGFVVHLRDLLLGTVRLWARLFPHLAIIWMLGWLVQELSVRITTQIPLQYVYPALVVFGLGFLGSLGAIVLMLRLIAEELGLWELIPDDEEDHSVSSVLSVTLLPFLGIYAAVDEVARRVDELSALALLQTGVLADRTIITEIDPFRGGPNKLWLVIGLIVGAYVVRRIVDLVHEHTGWRALGILVTVLEAYFLLLLIMAGTQILARIADWVDDRVALQWVDDAGSALAGFFTLLGWEWPAFLAALGTLVSEVVWPLFRDALAQPVIWLAVAALVFGSKVLSVAGLWQQGRPLLAQVPVPRRLRRLQLARAQGSGSRSLRRLWLEFQEIFLGDLDDKYLPTLQSLRLILRSGAGFLGAFLVVYALIELIGRLWEWVVLQVVGGHDVVTWAIFGAGLDLITVLPVEALRICLLGLAFHRCLLIFRARALPVPTHPVAPAARPTAAVH